MMCLKTLSIGEQIGQNKVISLSTCTSLCVNTTFFTQKQNLNTLSFLLNHLHSNLHPTPSLVSSTRPLPHANNSDTIHTRLTLHITQKQTSYNAKARLSCLAQDGTAGVLSRRCCPLHHSAGRLRQTQEYLLQSPGGCPRRLFHPLAPILAGRTLLCPLSTDRVLPPSLHTFTDTCSRGSSHPCKIRRRPLGTCHSSPPFFTR